MLEKISTFQKIKLPRKNDWIIAAGFFIATLATRFPLRDHLLYSWDSGSFALGLERFQMCDWQPHPPGYILYIFLGRIVNFFFHDANTSLVSLSILSASIAVAGIFLLGKSIFGDLTGIVAAILLLFSPLAWFFGEVALTYIVELPIVIAVTWFLYQLLFFRRYPVITAIAIGIAAGFRQDIIMFLVPIWFVGSLRVGPKKMLFSWVGLGVSILVWLIPLSYFTGGLSQVLELNKWQFDTYASQSSIFSGGWQTISSNSRIVLRDLSWLLGAATFLLLFFPALFLLPGRLYRDRRIFFLLLVLLPPISFFILIHDASPGYLLVQSTSIFLLTAHIMVCLANHARNTWFNTRTFAFGKKNSQALPSILLAFSLIIFGVFNSWLFIKGSQIMTRVQGMGGTVSEIYGSFSADGLRQNELQLADTLAAINTFRPDETLIIVSNLTSANWRRLSYYLPEYRVIMVDKNPIARLNGKDHVHEHFEGTIITVYKQDKVLVIGFKPEASSQITSVATGPLSEAIYSADITPAGLKIDDFTIYPGNQPDNIQGQEVPCSDWRKLIKS